jgi:tRNA A-37 threonylcarbamoyl transferase component Bud32
MLITRSLDDTQQLNRFVHQVLPTFSAERQARIRRQLADSLGRFVARMHDAGVRHNDLHAGNLLLRLNTGDDLELFLIDLNDVHFGQSLTWRQSLANLVILNHWFILQASRADRCRFWLSYLRARPRSWSARLRPHAPEVRLWARRLERATWQSLHKHWQRRDRRCLVDNRYYRCLNAAHAAGHAVTDLDVRLAESLLADPDAPIRRTDVVRHKSSPSSTVVEFTGRVNGRLMRLIYKRFGVKRTSTPWTSLVRMPPALRSWQLGQGFRERGLPTARPLLVLHRRRRGMLHEGYLLTEKIEAAHHLHDCLTHLGSLPPAERRRWLRNQIPRLAQAVREMHRRQVSHRDLKSPNIMLAESDCTAPQQPLGATPSLFPVPMAGIWFLDLAGASLHTRLGTRRRVQNLARLNAGMHEQRVLTCTDRLRFLRSYLQWGLFGKHGWKKWWKAIDQATQKKLERNQRIGRCVA